MVAGSRACRSGTIAIGVIAAFIAGCDPAEEPPVWEDGAVFLVVGKAGEQSRIAHEIGAYVQARGGNFVGLVTHGCRHRFGSASATTESCTALPGAQPGSEPLYLMVEPTGPECRVEARLYAICGEITTDDIRAPLQYCDTEGVLVTSAQATLWVGPPVDAGASGDGGTDAPAARDGSADAGRDASVEAGAGDAQGASDG